MDEKFFQLLEQTSEDNEELQFFDLIEQLAQNPIDLNKANIDELLKIPFLNSNDAKIIIEAREKLESFNSYNELYSINGLHPDLIILLKPFTVITQEIPHIDSKSNTKKLIFELRSRILTDIQTRKGFLNNNYDGDKLKLYNRIKVDYNNFRFGLIQEKDPGEISILDHYAGFVEYKSSDLIKNILIGDFNYEFGEGLVIWSPYSFSKGNDAINANSKRARGIIPHVSTEENKFFRGSAISLQFNSLTFSGFYSYNKIDASINESDRINSLPILGYHRTISEQIIKEKVVNSSYAVTLNYKLNNAVNIGLLHTESSFNKSFVDKGKQNLLGNKFTFSSIFFKMHSNTISASTEIAYNYSAFSSIINLFFPFNNNILFSITYRNYSPYYTNLFANGFGEYSNTKNEIGYYLGCKIKTDLGVFNIYYDIYKTPNESFKSDFPASGNDFLINYNTKILNNTNLNLKYKSEYKEISINGYHLKNLSEEKKQNFRIDLTYNLTKNIYGKSRFEYVNYLQSNTSEKGFLTYQDVKLKLQNKLSLAARIIFFQTDSYNSRLYEFENDLRGLMTNLPMFGEGFRWYCLISYKPLQSLNFYFKYAETYKPGEKNISSGNSEIIGNLDNKVSFQVDYKF